MTHGPTDPSVIAFLSYKRNKNLVPRALLSYISTWEFLRTLEKCEKKKFPSAYITQQRTLRVFYFFKINANFI